MVNFAKWKRRLDALTHAGVEDPERDGWGRPVQLKLYTLPHSWRCAATHILTKPVQEPSYFESRPDATSGEIDNLTKLEPRRTAVKDKTSKKKTDDLTEMKEAFRRHNDRQAGGGSKNDWDKLKDGKNHRFILPRPGERKFYTEAWTHFNVGPNERALRCLDEAHIDPERGLPASGTKCKRCKKFLREQARINSEYPKGDEEGREEWKRAKDKYVPRHQYYSNVLRKDDEGDFEVKTIAYGPQIWGQLMNYYLGDDSDVGDFTNPKSGRWINIKKENKGGRNRRNVEYKVFPVDGQDIADAWPAIKEALHDLEAAAGKIVSAEEFAAIESGVDVDKDSDDSSDDSSSGSNKRRKPKEDDDEDDDRDDDKEEEEEDRPVKVKNSKLAGKMKNRRDD